MGLPVHSLLESSNQELSVCDKNFDPAAGVVHVLLVGQETLHL